MKTHRRRFTIISDGHNENFSKQTILFINLPYLVSITNKSVIEEIKPTNPLEAVIKKLSYFGHIMRMENSLERSIMLGMGAVAVQEREADHEHAG